LASPNLRLCSSIRCLLLIQATKARSENEWLVNVINQFLQYQKDRVSRKEVTGSTPTHCLS